MFRQLITLLVSFIILSVFAYDVQANRLDPTKPLIGGAGGSTLAKEQELKLTSIIRSANYKKAMINERLMAIGDNIGEHKLIAINNNSVVLQSANGQLTLTIFSNVVAVAK